jgi:hypothetical protein
MLLEQPSKLDLIINVTTARIFGRESFLFRVDEIIE